ncbi:DUF262 domain-containing protein [Flavobacterium oreochromis]|uniref:DUF262 domain-containing protein n=1 Tax=Flavobacterium oreochromis TaxID=2906078 RepID=UPI00385FF2D3
MNYESQQILLRPVSDILDYKFFVPSYQRGYRWTATEVKALLDDIYEFILENEKSDKGVFYCLQPLIVYSNEDKYHVIDGQQRLTTIYIILTYLKDVAAIFGKGKYELTYETRPDSEEYLTNICETKSNENVDYFHIYNAYKAVEEWFGNRDGVIKAKILTTLTASNEEGKNVKFIWYKIDANEAIDVFTRINIGKIPLTNAELIKALLVKEKNFTDNSIAKKIAIASEWDEIEKKLSNPSFWYFLSNLDHSKKYDNKIEYLLDIIAEKKSDSEKLHTFFYFNNLINKHKTESNEDCFDIDNVWIIIKDKFQILEEWFNDHVLYHYIGYLLSTGTTITDVLEISKSTNKDEFVKNIKRQLKSHYSKIVLDELAFDKSKDKKIIRRVLLLFNIETILQSKKSHIRFPFDKYKMENWDIEHINPQNPFDKIEFYKEWCSDLLEYVTGSKIDISKLDNSEEGFKDFYEELTEDLDGEEIIILETVIDILNDEIDFKAKTEELSMKLYKKYKGNESENNNHISNLTLLDAVTNRGYGNSLFPIKRNTIIKNDGAGVFIPICTKNVFLKYYSKKLSDVMYWKESDAKAYFENINLVLSYYLN